MWRCCWAVLLCCLYHSLCFDAAIARWLYGLTYVLPCRACPAALDVECTGIVGAPDSFVLLPSLRSGGICCCCCGGGTPPVYRGIVAMPAATGPWPERAI